MPHEHAGQIRQYGNHRGSDSIALDSGSGKTVARGLRPSEISYTTRRVIRVGFEALGGAGWMGGKTYLWNLLFAVSQLADSRLRAVLLSPEPDAELLALPGVEHFAVPAGLNQRPAQWAGRALRYSIGRDLIREHFLAPARLDLLSHGATLGRRSPLPAISWIPDLQHRRRPEFFSRFELLGTRPRRA